MAILVILRRTAQVSRLIKAPPLRTHSNQFFLLDIASALHFVVRIFDGQSKDFSIRRKDATCEEGDKGWQKAIPGIDGEPSLRYIHLHHLGKDRWESILFVRLDLSIHHETRSE